MLVSHHLKGEFSRVTPNRAIRGDGCTTLPNILVKEAVQLDVPRVWDMFLCDGVKIIFRVGLVSLKFLLGTRISSRPVRVSMKPWRSSERLIPDTCRRAS
ncbi:hypothetical protein AMELA_G00177870 [Ameiurus melas]|uniref:Uncharacterized protein n=1 Tax=Ameiurus melas TaxID=219545 RepID=A0A7J6ABM4_AMEME|nr:hypothetical protein AMELA_G00177870 [Ameiurus melas]